MLPSRQTSDEHMLEPIAQKHKQSSSSAENNNKLKRLKVKRSLQNISQFHLYACK